MSRKCVPCREELGLLIMRTATMIRRKADSNVYMNKVHKITGSNGWILGEVLCDPLYSIQGVKRNGE